MTKRRSLADRNRSAIANTASSDDRSGDDETFTAVPKPDAPPAPDPTNTTNTRRISLTMTGSLYSECKAAFLADWSNGGAQDRFAHWVAEAFRGHADRTPAERAMTEAEATGSPRSFVIPESIFKQIKAAIVQDQKAGRWLTVSGWCVEALTAAVLSAKSANNDALPTPPERLPPRLIR